MTELQAIAHADQVEAAREEFRKLWLEKIQPKEYELLKERRGPAIWHLCWHTFLHAKGLSK
jgi:hypothetical protein